MKTYTRKDKKDLHLIMDSEKRSILSFIGTTGKGLTRYALGKGWKEVETNEVEKTIEYSGIINNYKFYFSDTNRIEKVEIF